MSQFYQEVFALLFGAFIVVLFSYERFNRTTYDTGTRLERLVALLSPDKMRARRVIIRVWLYYCLGLLAFYAMLCIYADVLPNLDVDIEAGAANPDEGSIGIPPSISLGVALILTGLAPSVPVLRRIEEWGRVTAHRVAGIPTRVLSDTDVLRRSAISLKKMPSDSLMIPKGDWDRRNHYSASAVNQITDPEDFDNDLDIIFAVSAWILERRLKLNHSETREKFQPIEAELSNRKDVLVLELDERSGFVLGGGAVLVDAAPDAPENGDEAKDAIASELKRKSWDRLASDADKLAEDMCILLALYVEHGLVPHREILVVPNASASPVVTPTAQENGARKSMRQHDLALERLCDFLTEIRENAAPGQQASFALHAFLWCATVVLVLTTCWSLWPGNFELGLRDGTESVPWGRRVLRFALISLNGFILPLAVFLVLRDSANQAQKWNNVWKVHWTASLPQISIGLFVSWLISMLFVISVSLWIFVINGRLESIEAWENITVVFEREMLMVLRGCVLSLFVLLLLDAHHAHVLSPPNQPTWKASLRWALKAGIVTAAFGALARITQSLVAARKWGRDGLDAIDMGLIFYATIYSALIGFCVIFFLSEALLNQKNNRRRPPAVLLKSPAE